jgi:dTDP-L-rhamnose 4-epimerase
VATTVNDVVASLFGAFGTEVPARVSGNFRLGDIRHNIADTRRLREILGFTASVSFEEGLSRFVEWVLEEPVEGDSYERSLEEMASRNLLK